jgi:hypothetical protein
MEVDHHGIADPSQGVDELSKHSHTEWMDLDQTFVRASQSGHERIHKWGKPKMTKDRKLIDRGEGSVLLFIVKGWAEGLRQIGGPVI